jgi:hypothetical protein
LLILKKPFDPIEVQQIASALTEKWNDAGARARTLRRGALQPEQKRSVYAASLVTLNRALETARAGAVARCRPSRSSWPT